MPTPKHRPSMRGKLDAGALRACPVGSGRSLGARAGSRSAGCSATVRYEELGSCSCLLLVPAPWNACGAWPNSSPARWGCPGAPCALWPWAWPPGLAPLPPAAALPNCSEGGGPRHCTGPAGSPRQVLPSPPRRPGTPGLQWSRGPDPTAGAHVAVAAPTSASRSALGRPALVPLHRSACRAASHQPRTRLSTAPCAQLEPDPTGLFVFPTAPAANLQA